MRTYRSFKANFGLEKYLTVIENPDHRKAISQLRMSSHPLNIEAQRGVVNNPSDRVCQVCPQNTIEDEEHFLMNCGLYVTKRQEISLQLVQYPNLSALTNHEKFLWLMTCEDKPICKALSKFVHESLEMRKSKLRLRQTTITNRTPGCVE